MDKKAGIPLQKFMAGCGVASRRQAERLIADGTVTVNGNVAALGVCVDPEVDVVAFRNVPLQVASRIYVVLNKPSGVVTTASDNSQRKTVVDCLLGLKARLFPVGRLSKEAEGAILLTNDGELAYRLMHPDYHVEGAYLAWVEGIVQQEDVAVFERGAMLDGEAPVRAKAIALYSGVRTTLVRIVIREGKKHSVRRLCEAHNHPVFELRRISFANVNVEGLKPGEWRYLSEEEVASLRRLTHLDE